MQDRYNNLTGSDYLTGGLDAFGKVTGYFGSVEARKAAQEQANALIAQGKSNVEVARIMQETERLKLEAAKAGVGAENTGGNNTLYIALGVSGVVILALVIFAVTRKKS